MPEIFSQLFESRVKARLIKFFMLNDKREYSQQEVVQKNKMSSVQVTKELNRFEKMKMIIVRTKKGKRFFQTNTGFIFYPELKNLVVKSNTMPECRSLSQIKNLGKVRLALISGVFLNYPKGRADLLLVGDEMSRAKLKHLLENLEAEVGKEINYSFMSSDEFKYRTDMLDKFIMEFLESPYEEIICKVPNLKEIANRRAK
jgi:phage pi2 protein 07